MSLSVVLLHAYSTHQGPDPNNIIGELALSNVGVVFV